MLERVGIAVALIAMGYFAFCATRCYLLWRASKLVVTDPLLKDSRRGVPTILYFTTPTCAPCQFTQRPALSQLQAELGDAIQIIQIDATQDPDAATRWNVQTVPTTYILDKQGNAKQVNHGVALASKLRQQIEAI